MVTTLSGFDLMSILLGTTTFACSHNWLYPTKKAFLSRPHSRTAFLSLVVILQCQMQSNPIPSEHFTNGLARLQAINRRFCQARLSPLTSLDRSFLCGGRSTVLHIYDCIAKFYDIGSWTWRLSRSAAGRSICIQAQDFNSAFVVDWYRRALFGGASLQFKAKSTLLATHQLDDWLP